VLKLLHTADWHLGKKFPSFTKEAADTLMRSRLDVVDRILDLAVRERVHAVLCAGDLFDVPDPLPVWWKELAHRLHRRANDTMPPVILVPGNHDPLTADSVWWPTHAFRARLPEWVHIVDRDDFSFALCDGAVIFAAPCRTTAGQNDLAMALPARAPGDAGLRIGCVHGSTFDLKDWLMNFPIQRDAGERRGLDYLAIGDTHAFRDINADLPWPSIPTVYPGAPEPTAFDEKGAGNVAIVAMYAHGRRPIVVPQRVAYWTWREETCRSLTELKGILALPDLERHVLRLKLDFTVSIVEESEVDRILTLLRGTEAAHPRVGVLERVDTTNLRLVATDPDAFDANLPPVVLDTVARLRKVAEDAEDEADRARATRAISHLYKLLQRVDTGAAP
jgi:DNA repair exonuclease SbcCD nuclease subunit